MLAGIFATKKRAACFATPRGKKRRRASHRAPEIRVRVIDRSPEAEPTPPPTLNGSICLGNSKQGGRMARSPCRTIRQTVTDWPEEPSQAMLPPPVTPSRRCRPTSCDDDDDDAWSTATRRRPVPPCWPQPQALPCSAQPLVVLPQAPGRKQASPSRWRKTPRRGLIGCASYSWISLIWAALNGSQ